MISKCHQDGIWQKKFVILGCAKCEKEFDGKF